MILLLWMKAVTSLAQNGSSRADTLQSGWSAAMFKVHPIAWEISGIQINRIHCHHHTAFTNDLAIIQPLQDDEI